MSEVVHSNKTVSEINQEVKSVLAVHEKSAADKIREYSASQKHLWQQLPYLALQVDGQRGYSSQRQWLYEHGLYRVSGRAEGIFGIYIDCANGNILEQHGEVDYEGLADDVDVVEVWRTDLNGFLRKEGDDPFDAAKIVERYRQEALGEERAAKAKRLGLTAMYARTEQSCTDHNNLG